MVWLLCSSLVLADAIAVPVEPSCPPGARLFASHLGVWCVDTSCISNDDCYADEVCQSTALCVNDDEVLAVCEEDSCDEGECVSGKRCIALHGTTNIQLEPGCGGCATTSPTGVISLGLLGLLLRRRRTGACR